MLSKLKSILDKVFLAIKKSRDYRESELNYLLEPDSPEPDLDEFRILVQDLNLNAITSSADGPPLHTAIWNEKGEELIKILIEAGANANLRNMFGRTPLHLAVPKGNKRVVEILIEHGADVNAQTDQGNTPLQFALELTKNQEITEILKSHGAKTGYTPLDLNLSLGINAVIRGHIL